MRAARRVSERGRFGAQSRRYNGKAEGILGMKMLLKVAGLALLALWAVAVMAQSATSPAPAGMLWVSWPKKSSGVATDLDENVVRDIGLAAGLVDVKVCAVTDVWSGLKFVRRLKDR